MMSKNKVMMLMMSIMSIMMCLLARNTKRDVRIEEDDK